jgi:hypothetical protein
VKKEVQSICHTEIESPGKCTRQSALTVERNARSRSNPTELDQSTAENALPREDPKDQGSAAGDPLDPVHQTEDTR